MKQMILISRKLVAYIFLIGFILASKGCQQTENTRQLSKKVSIQYDRDDPMQAVGVRDLTEALELIVESALYMGIRLEPCMGPLNWPSRSALAVDWRP